MADGMISTPALSELAAPFPDAAISWRVGSTTKAKDKGMALAYIDARDVMERLDAVCGAANWSDQYVETEKGRIICTLSIRIDGEWIAKSDGAGDSDVESEKGAISDALKRAAVKWRIGRYLYDMPSPWVEIEEFGRSFRMKQSERSKLDKIHREYVRNTFKNAGPSDAGERKPPKAQLATGAEAPPHASAPVNHRNTPDVSATKIARQLDRDMKAGKEPSLETPEMRKARLAKEGDADFAALLEDMRRQTSTRDLKAWGASIAAKPSTLSDDQKNEMQAAYKSLMAGLRETEEYAARVADDANAEFEERV